MVIDKPIVLSLPAVAEYIDIARLALFGIADKMGFSYEDIEDMKVAIAEACTNVVLHAYKESEEGTIEIVFQPGPNELTMSVSDKGSSFPYEGASDEPPYHNQSLDELTAGGLGIYLMQALMDRVDIDSENGTKVILTKYVQPTSS